MNYTTPILFLIFNRPDTTKQVIERIREVKPTRLFVAADGPRGHVPGEEQRCSQARELVQAAIDWPCEVKLLFRKDNLGCGRAVSEAIQWFFGQVEYGIILEDDTYPSRDFFSFMEFALLTYQYDVRIFSVNGCSLGYRNTSFDYGVTRYFNMWGWGAWRRSVALVNQTWKDPALDAELLKKKVHLGFLKRNRFWYAYWMKHFNLTYRGEIDTWDYQFVYTVLLADKWVVRPNNNMVINLGYNDTATHTTDIDSPLARLVHVPLKNKEQINGRLIGDIRYEIQYVAKAWNSVNVDFPKYMWSRLKASVLARMKF